MAVATGSLLSAFTGSTVLFSRERGFRRTHVAEKEPDIIDSRGQPLSERPKDFLPSIRAFLDQHLSLPPRPHTTQHGTTAVGATNQDHLEHSSPPDLSDEQWTQISSLVIDEIGLKDMTCGRRDAQSLQEAVRQPPLRQTCRYLREELLPRAMILRAAVCECEGRRGVWS